MPSNLIANPVQRLFEIGKFFERLTISTVGGKRSTGDYTEADIEHIPLDAWVESKGIGSSQQPSLGQLQFDKRLDQCGFPYRYCLYALWVYRNTRQHRISQEPARLVDFRKALARRVQALYFLDIRVLAALRDKYGIAVRYRNSHVSDVLRLSTTVLRRVQSSPRNFLYEVGLDPDDFFIQQEDLRSAVRGCPIYFRATSILPLEARDYVWPLHRRYRRRHKKQ